MDQNVVSQNHQGAVSVFNAVWTTPIVEGDECSVASLKQSLSGVPNTSESYFFFFDFGYNFFILRNIN